MSPSRRTLMTMGIVNIVVAVAFYFGSEFYVGMAWDAAYHFYVALDTRHIIDQEKLSAYEEGRFAKGRALGEHLVTYPSRAALDVCEAGTVLLALNGIVLCIATAATGKSLGQQTLPPESTPSS